MMQEVEHKEVSQSITSAPDVAPGNVLSTNITIPPTVAAGATGVVAEELASEEQSRGWGISGWLKSASSNQFVQKMMEKTKTSVDKMITTLDPGMAPYIKSGGDVDVVVASDEEVKWCPVRDAFQSVFGAATVTGIAAPSNVAPQPVGYNAGMKGAQERIKSLRKSGEVVEGQVCLAIEGFVVEQLPDQWFDVACLLLDDPRHNIKLELFSLAVPVDNDVISEMQKATPSDYDMRWSGLAMTVGEAIQRRLPWVTPSDWHRALTGQSRREILHSASMILAELYKRRLPRENHEQQI